MSDPRLIVFAHEGEVWFLDPSTRTVVVPRAVECSRGYAVVDFLLTGTRVDRSAPEFVQLRRQVQVLEGETLADAVVRQAVGDNVARSRCGVHGLGYLLIRSDALEKEWAEDTRVNYRCRS